jgi:hypothetical protein
MDAIKNWLKGKKTYLLVLLYVILVLATGVDADETVISSLDPDKLKEALMGLMVATGKAAWDRFADR